MIKKNTESQQIGVQQRCRLVGIITIKRQQLKVNITTVANQMFKMYTSRVLCIVTQANGRILTKTYLPLVQEMASGQVLGFKLHMHAYKVKRHMQTCRLAVRCGAMCTGVCRTTALHVHHHHYLW